MWPFSKKPDPNNPCKWGHDYEPNTYTDENGIIWDEYKCTKCDSITRKQGKRTIINEYPIYMCTAPFGILFSKTTGTINGSMSGVLTFNSGSLNGSLTNSLEEKYIIKYLDGNQLKSKTLDAKNAKVFIGGKKLVITVNTQEHYTKKGNISYSGKPESQSDSHWAIHIPKLPDVEKLTSTFQKLGTSKEDET